MAGSGQPILRMPDKLRDTHTLGALKLGDLEPGNACCDSAVLVVVFLVVFLPLVLLPPLLLALPLPRVAARPSVLPPRCSLPRVADRPSALPPMLPHRAPHCVPVVHAMPH